MEIVFSNFWHLLSMVVFLCVSAFYSGAETAILNLSRRQLESFSKSPHPTAKTITALLKRPKDFLAGLLLAIMIANTVYFAFGSVLVFEINSGLGPRYASLAAFIVLATMILFGEMLPKSLAYSNSQIISSIAAIPCLFTIKLLGPVRVILTTIFVDPILRLLFGAKPKIEPITLNQFRFLIESSRQRGLIGTDENQLLSEILDFGTLKIRHVMRPRVDILAVPVNSDAGLAKTMMKEHKLSELPVYGDSIDNILGIIDLPALLLKAEKSIADLLKPAYFVPEQKSIESLLEYFRKSRSETAIVVDEYGQIAGTISQQDLLEELVGPLEPVATPVEMVGPLSYRLSGNLAIHDWAAAFDIDTTQMRLSTIGGLVTSILGKLPKPGDQAHLRNLRFTVEKVRKRRIETLILDLEPIAQAKQGAK